MSLCSSWSWLIVLFVASPVLAQTPDGAAIYKQQCARCHGANGEGSKQYKQRLEGDRSVAQLAEVIRKTMPENDPGSLTVAQSQAVAEYIHKSFYGPLAREGNKPARVALARLTVPQYRQAVADLVGSFRWQARWDAQRGLDAEYFKGRRLNPRDRVLKRIDPQVAFDFGTESPAPGKTEPHEFSIRWTGSILVPETGEYRFVIRTEHAARLWLNDQRRPFIDAWVKSGNDTEYSATIFLVAGRIYPLRLEYSKAKQGVDDSNKIKNKPPSPKSSVTLLWQLPHRSVEVVPSRYLSPAPAPEQFVCTRPFPPDDRSFGWERGTTVSREWDAATTEAALEATAYIAARMNELAGTREGDPEQKKKLQAFCRTFAERAFRRPLTAEQQKLLERQFEAGKDLESSVKRCLLLTLKSPRFLYREVGDEPDGYAVASRLSFGLWDSIPDKELLEAAAAGRLATKEQVRKQAERMLPDPRARAKLRSFLLTWLRLNEEHDLSRDPKIFPGFDAATVSDLRTSLELFLDEVVWSSGSDYRQLLTAEEVYLNDRLARFYGVKLPEGAGFRKVKLDPGKRAGVTTYPYLMALLSQGEVSSPIHRGVLLARGFLGVALKPPPEAVAPLSPRLHPNLTTRERVLLQTRPGACMTCHGIINPLGFALEHFDAVGRFRDQENGKAIDATGWYQARDGKMVRVNGARELASFLAGSSEAHAAFAEQMFHHLVQQPVRAYGQNTLEELRRSFVSGNFHIRNLAVEVITVAALQSRQKAPPQGEARK